MSVKITLEFKSAEEAILALGKLAGVKAAAAAPLLLAAPKEPAKVVEPQQTAQPETPKRTRKPRADAGQPRGPYKTNESPAPAGEANAVPAVPQSAAVAPAASGVSEPAAPVADKAASSAAATTAAAVPTPTLEDVQKAVEKLYEAKDYDGTKDTLARFGVKRGQDLLPEQRAEFIAKVNRVVDQGEAI